MKNVTLKIDNKYSYKIGLDEIIGLEKAMREVFKPIEKLILDKCYWQRGNIHLVDTAEYKSRDGFIAHSHNCGGLEVQVVVPECESIDFDFLTFGTWDGEHYCDGKNKENCECPYSNDGELDAMLRIWFKFEGLEDGTLKFYLYMGGGNNDAPYFRTKYSEDYFEASFECKSLAGLKRAASKHIKALIKVMENK